MYCLNRLKNYATLYTIKLFELSLYFRLNRKQLSCLVRINSKTTQLFFFTVIRFELSLYFFIYLIMKCTIIYVFFRFICDHCKKRFADKTKLRDHIEDKHLHKVYNCHICNKVKYEIF